VRHPAHPVLPVAEDPVRGGSAAFDKGRDSLQQRRCHKTIKGACIRVHTPLSLADARTVVADFVDHYNTRRLHSAIGYVTPKDKPAGAWAGKLEGRAETILAQREAKLALARETRRAKRKVS